MDSESEPVNAALFVYHTWDKTQCGLTAFHCSLLEDFAHRQKGKIKVYATVLEATEEQKEDAEKAGITLIAPQPIQTFFCSDEPSMKWLIGHEPYFPEFKELKETVKYVVGYIPKTADAAYHIRDRTFTKASLVMINHVRGNPDFPCLPDSMTFETFEEMLLQAAEKADLLFSIGPGIYNYHKRQYRGLPAEKRHANVHMEIIPKLVTFDKGEDNEKKCVSDNDSDSDSHNDSHNDNDSPLLFSHRKIDSDKSIEGCKTLVAAVGEASERRKKACKSVPQWRVSGATDDQMHDKAQKYFDKKEFILHKYTSDKAKLRRYLLQCDLCFGTTCHQEYGFDGLEAIATGVPHIFEEGSQPAQLIERHFSSHNTCIVARGRNKLTKKIIEILNKPQQAVKAAKKLKKRYSKSIKVKRSYARFSASFTCDSDSDHTLDTSCAEPNESAKVSNPDCRENNHSARKRKRNHSDTSDESSQEHKKLHESPDKHIGNANVSDLEIPLDPQNPGVGNGIEKGDMQPQQTENENIPKTFVKSPAKNQQLTAVGDSPDRNGEFCPKHSVKPSEKGMLKFKIELDEVPIRPERNRADSTSDLREISDEFNDLSDKAVQERTDEIKEFVKPGYLEKCETGCISLHIRFRFLSHLYRFKAKVKSGRFAETFEPLLITKQMKERAAENDVYLQLQATYEDRNFNEIETFFIERDGGSTPPMTVNFDDAEDATSDEMSDETDEDGDGGSTSPTTVDFGDADNETRDEMSDDDVGPKIPPITVTFGDADDEASDEVRDKTALKSLYLEVQSILESKQSVVKEYFTMVHAAKRCSRLKGPQHDIICAEITKSPRLKHIFRSKRDILRLLGIQKYLWSDVSCMLSFATVLEKLVTRESIPTADTTTKSYSYLIISLLPFVVHPKQFSLCDRHVLHTLEKSLGEALHTQKVKALLQNQVEDLNSEKETLQKQCSALKEEKQKQEMVLGKQIIKQRDMQSKLETKDKRIVGQMEDLINENKTLQQQCSTYRSKLRKVEDVLVREMSNRGNIQYELETKSKHIAELEIENSKLKKQLPAQFEEEVTLKELQKTGEKKSDKLQDETKETGNDEISKPSEAEKATTEDTDIEGKGFQDSLKKAEHSDSDSSDDDMSKPVYTNKDSSTKWFKTVMESPVKREQHEHLVLIYVLSPILYGQTYQSEKWLKWAAEIGIYSPNSDDTKTVRTLKDDELANVEVLEGAHTNWSKLFLQKGRRFLKTMLDLYDRVNMCANMQDAFKTALMNMDFTAICNDFSGTLGEKCKSYEHVVGAVLLTLKEYCSYVKKQTYHNIDQHKNFDLSNSLKEMESNEMRNLGNKEFRDAKYRIACQIYSSAIYIDPYNDRLYCNRALTYLKMGDYQDALSDGKRAIVLKAAWPKSQYRYAEALFKLEQYEKAAKANLKALAICKANHCETSELRDLETQREYITKKFMALKGQVPKSNEEDSGSHPHVKSVKNRRGYRRKAPQQTSDR